MPGARAEGTGGDRTFVPLLAKAAIASGANGLYFEIHPDPDSATCDSANQIAIAQFPRIIIDCLKIWEVVKSM
jgi:2-dehydro-3-deoxyphosphooctonate aldolase (KDO 8-P synthase)